MQRERRGFTLLELMMVVVIIGILATIAIPQYLKTAERARMSEAVSMLGQIRGSQMRYRAATGAFATALNALDFDPVTDSSGTLLFGYAIGNTGFPIEATRTGNVAIGGCRPGYKVSITETGNLTGLDCQQ